MKGNKLQLLKVMTTLIIKYITMFLFLDIVSVARVKFGSYLA